MQKMCDDAAFVNDLRNGVDEFILNKYNWKDIAEATKALYEKVLAK